MFTFLTNRYTYKPMCTRCKKMLVYFAFLIILLHILPNTVQVNQT